MRARFLAFALLLSLLAASAVKAAPTQLTWYGHSAFKITTPSGKIVLLEAVSLAGVDMLTNKFETKV